MGCDRVVFRSVVAVLVQVAFGVVVRFGVIFGVDVVAIVVVRVVDVTADAVLREDFRLMLGTFVAGQNVVVVIYD